LAANIKQALLGGANGRLLLANIFQFTFRKFDKFDLPPRSFRRFSIQPDIFCATSDQSVTIATMNSSLVVTGFNAAAH